MPTIAQYLQELVRQRDTLAANITAKGVTASANEKFNTLVPKVLDIPSGIDTSDATATANDMKYGVTAYVDGTKITGNAHTETNAINAKTAGYIDGSNHWLEPGFYSGISFPAEETLIPGNIKAGVTIYGVTGTYDGDSGGGTVNVFDCSECENVEDINALYHSKFWVSDDGAFESFHLLPETYGYDKISPAVSNNVAGIDLRCETAKVGMYYRLPQTFSSSRALLRMVFYVSTWINPSINISLISADSVDDIPDKIRAEDYAWTTTVTLANVNNGSSQYTEVPILPVGDNLYVFIHTTSAVGGNECILSSLEFIVI